MQHDAIRPRIGSQQNQQNQRNNAHSLQEASKLHYSNFRMFYHKLQNAPKRLPWSARRPRGMSPIVPTSTKTTSNDTKSCRNVTLKFAGISDYILYVFAMDAMTYFHSPENPDIHEN